MAQDKAAPYAERESERTAKNGCATLVGGGGLLLLRDDLVDLQAEAFGYAGAVSGIGFVEVLDLQLLDAARDAAHASDDVADEALFGVGGHQAEEIAWLSVVIGVEAVIVAVDRAGDFFRSLTVLRSFFRAAEAVGFVVGLRAVIAVKAHGAAGASGAAGTGSCARRRGGAKGLAGGTLRLKEADQLRPNHV